jgi:hypothetical protein
MQSSEEREVIAELRTEPLRRHNHDSWLYRGISGAIAGLIGAGLMALMQLALRRYLRRRCTAGWLADAGIGFQAGFRTPEPAGLTAQCLLSDRSVEANHPAVCALASMQLSERLREQRTYA